MKKLILFSIVFILLQSCGTQKKVIQATGTAEEKALHEFFSQYQSHLPTFSDVQIKSKIKADVNGRSLNASLKLYIQNDKKIWANASILGITGARAQITPYRVQAYNVLDKNYIDSDFQFFNQKFNIDFLNYDRLQQLLTGQLFLISNLNNYNLKVNNNNQYVLAYKYNNKLEQNPVKGKYIHTFYLDSNYRLRKATIIESTEKIVIDVIYDDWQQFGEKNFPSIVKVIIKGKKQDEIELNYNNFDFEKMNPPFRIPNGYAKQEIK